MEWNCLLIVVSLFLETHFKREIFLELHPTQSVSTPEVSEGSQWGHREIFLVDSEPRGFPASSEKTIHCWRPENPPDQERHRQGQNNP